MNRAACQFKDGQAHCRALRPCNAQQVAGSGLLYCGVVAISMDCFPPSLQRLWDCAVTPDILRPR